MLTEPAFNALLKTLEEPPPGVIFILATTHAHKIPPTILSRCQRHDFRRLGQAEILPRLEQIAREEGAAVSDGAMKAIARAAEGSLRDAQSLLDQAIAYSGDAVSEEDVAVVLGLVEGELLAQTTQAIIERDSSRALAVVESLSARGDDLQRFCQELLAHLRDVMVSKVSKDPTPLLQLSRVPPETVRSQAEAMTLADLETIFQVLSRAEFEMRRARIRGLFWRWRWSRRQRLGRYKPLRRFWRVCPPWRRSCWPGGALVRSPRRSPYSRLPLRRHPPPPDP